MKIKFMISKKNILSFFLGLICIFLLISFPTKGVFQKLLTFSVFFLLIPVLYIKIVLKEDLADYGVKLRNLRKGFFWMLILILAYLPLIYLVYAHTVFPVEYAPSVLVQKGFSYFILYEILLNIFFVAIYDFFFRGFLMLGVFKKTLYYSILIQAVILMSIFYLTDSLFWGNSLYLLIAPFSGIIAYKTKSLYFSSLLSFILILITDIFLIVF